MSDNLNFVYSLEVGRLTGPAADAARTLGLLNKGLESCARAIERLDAAPGTGLARIAKATEHATASTVNWERATSRATSRASDGARKVADDWERMAARADKAEQRKTAAHDKESAKRTAAAARESAHTAAIEARDEQRLGAFNIRVERRAAAASERAVQQELRNASRVSAAREKAMARATEKASHKSYFGGETSLSGLYTRQHDSQVSGLVSGMVGNLTPLGMAGNVVGAAGAAFSLVTDVVSAGASLAFQFGKMAVSSQAMRENSVAAFTSIYGSSEVGNRLFDEARRMGQLTKFETKDVVGIYNTLAANNFKQDELQKYSWAVADIASMRDPEKGQQFLTAISKIRSSKTATFGTLQSAGLAGPGSENVFTELGKITGKGEMGRGDWQKYTRGNNVTREQALDAVMRATIAKYDKKTGTIGDAAKEQGMGTWEGLISNIGEGLGNTLSRKSITDLPELKQFKTLLGSIGELFDENSVRGQKFGALMGKFVADVLIPFGGLQGKTDNILDKLLEGAGRVEEWFRGVMISIRDGIDGAMKDPGGTIEGFAVKIGMAIGSGIWLGVTGVTHGVSQYAANGIQDEAVKKGTILGDAQDWLDENGPRSWSRGGGWVNPLADPPGGSHASGGRVSGPGPYGSPVLTMMHVGEEVPGLHGQNMSNVMAAYGGGRSGGNSFHITVNAGGGAQDIANEVVRCIEMAQRNPTSLSAPG